jgi:RNA polymerase sigma-70 factor (ECF subfamily)
MGRSRWNQSHPVMPIPCEGDRLVATRTVDSMQRDLVVRASAGDHTAFSELAGAAIGGLYRVAHLILRDPELANDAVQNALIAAWRDVRGLRDPERFDAWLRRLTVRACYRVAGTRRRRAVREVELGPMHDTSSVDDDQRLVAVRDQLDRAFKRLTTEERAVIVLHYYLDLPLAEAADVMGMPVGTMKSRLNRATQALRAAVDAQERTSALSTGGIA